MNACTTLQPGLDAVMGVVVVHDSLWHAKCCSKSWAAVIAP